MDFKRDLGLIVVLIILFSLQFLHLAALDNRITELEKLHSYDYCSECGKLK